MDISLLQKKRLEYRPPLPRILEDGSCVRFEMKKGKNQPPKELREFFPLTFDQSLHELVRGEVAQRALSIGVVFSGGQAAGGHNVLAGLWDAMQRGKGGRLIGFLDGPAGIVENRWKELGRKEIDAVRNLGGFDLLGSGRTKIETAEQMEASYQTCQQLQLDGLVIVGGDDSNTNGALLAEYFLEKKSKTGVIGVPKTIDGDLRSAEIEISFGFDSACKTYSEMIGNIARDALSMKKYYHFIKLMGRSASHIALECAMATHPNLTFIGEEGKSLAQVVQEIVQLIVKRKEAKKEYGVILIPEGLIEFIPEMKALIQEINEILAAGKEVASQLSNRSKETFESLPEKIKKQLLMERDPHGNVAVSQIETEQLLMHLTRAELEKRGLRIAAQEHFFGYEGRSCLPSNFDAKYGYALGAMACFAVRDKLTGMICAIQNLAAQENDWLPKMVPIVQLMHMEMRKGKRKPVIQKTVVDINGKVFIRFSHSRSEWSVEDAYVYPGPIQFFGEPELTESTPITL